MRLSLLKMKSSTVERSHDDLSSLQIQLIWNSEGQRGQLNTFKGTRANLGVKAPH